MSRRRYHLERVDAELKTERRSRWKIREDPPVFGVESVYQVTDDNYAQRNSWEVLVRVPAARNGSIEVRPSVVPNVRAWAGLDRRALMFERVTLGRYRGGCYCKVAIAVPADDHEQMIALFLGQSVGVKRALLFSQELLTLDVPASLHDEGDSG